MRSGVLHATVAENLRTGQSTTRYTLETGQQKTLLRPTELAAAPGDQVVVTGKLRGERLVGSVQATTPSNQAAALTGPRKVAVLLATFSNGPDEPWSATEARSKVFSGANSANAFFREESYGGITLAGEDRADGDVFGWFTLNTPAGGCPYQEWVKKADEAAAAAGVALDVYQHVIYMVPHQSSCFWSGIAGVAHNGAVINGNAGVQVIAHELGHTFGLLHAGSWTCTSGGVRVQVSDTCGASEYGDPFDVMGNIATRHNSGWNLAKLGILAPGNVETIDASGIYSMRSALYPTADSTVLRIPRERTVDGDVTSWYYLEVRESGGIFENVVDASTAGVSIRVAPSPPSVSPETLLLDAHPATLTFQDAPLATGETFDGGPVQVKTLSAGGGGASVSVDLDEEAPTAPADLTATGGVERVQLQWGASTDNFGIDRYVVFRDGSMIETTASTSFTDFPAPVGEHEYVVYAEDASGNRSAASDPAMAAVEPDVEPPTAPTGLTAITGMEGVQLQWTASTDDVGVDRYLVYRNGTQVGNPGDGTSFLDSLAPAGEQSYVVYAEDAVGNRSAASEPATTTVPAIEGPTCAGRVCTIAYRYTGATAIWTVPPGVDEADFTVEGARGAGLGFNRGARVMATLGSLTAGQALTLSVGGAGEPYAEGGEGGFGGGGDGALGGGGGGFSSVALDSTLMLLAGGGGGQGLGGFNAVTGAKPGGGAGGQGGELGSPGIGGITTDAYGATLRRGQGGVSGGSGGVGGAGGEVTGTSTCAGGAFAGASGAAGANFSGGGAATGAGGGGGGGYVGGGQGGGGAGDACGSTAGAGGGGGGTSFASSGMSAEFTGGVRAGDGQVRIAYWNPISAAARSYLTEPDQELIVPAALGVLLDASGPSGIPLSASVASPPAHGSLTLEDDGSFTYAPASSYAGVDLFTYRVAAPSGDYAIAQVNLTVAAPPTASISGPSGGGTFVVGQSVPTAFTCSEGAGGPGLSSCHDSAAVKTKSGGTGHLDTATIGPHAYTVTAVSKDGLTGSASIGYSVVPKPQPPDGPGGPPRDPEEPRSRIDLSLGVEGRSLRDLLQTGKLAVTATINQAARVELAGSARLKVPASHDARAKSVAVLKRKTVSFVESGEKKVTLLLSRKGREALQRLSKLRLAIAGKATDSAGETVRQRVTLTLWR